MHICDDCRNEYYESCEECGRYHRREDMHIAHKDGDEVYVCNECFPYIYKKCDICGEYHYKYYMLHIDNYTVCGNCLNKYYTCCEECGKYRPNCNVSDINGCAVCDDCRDKYYQKCAMCGEYHHTKSMRFCRRGGRAVYICNKCKGYYGKCPHCDKLIATRRDGVCPACGVVINYW